MTGMTTPKVRTYTFENIPEELTELRQWVGFKFEPRGDKLSKVPVNPYTGHNADKTNPDDWTSFHTAKMKYEEGLGDGIGFVFTAADPYVGIDLDKVRGEKFAEDLIQKMGSYTELSPSGQGYHIIIRGKKAGKLCKVSPLSAVA